MGIFTLGVFKSTLSKFIQSRLAAQSLFGEVIKTSLSFFYRKIITVKTSNVVRSLILSSRANSGARFPDAARVGLLAHLVDEALAADPERIHLTFDFNPRPSRALGYYNLGQSKEEAIISVKSLISSYSSDPRALLVFSDGSFHPEKGGAGAAICPTLNSFSTYSLRKKAILSNHESEAAGVLAAVRLAKEICRDLQHRWLLIFVDNQVVILRTKNPATPKPRQWIFMQIDDAFTDLPSSLTISLVWCLGHRDIVGNEMADQLAKDALESPSMQALETKSNYKKVLHRMVQGIAPRKPKPSDLPIGYSALINQIDSGHCALKKHLFRICRAFNPLCPNCGAKETVFHLMNFCPKVKSQRAILRKQLRHLKIQFRSERLDRILNIWKAEMALAVFLRDSNRFPEQLPPQ